MKVILFCQNAYSFEIMRPIMNVCKQQGDAYLWFITPKLKTLFPFKEEPVTQSIQELMAFKSDSIICPGNEVPHYLKGLKVQIFHGLAGEKKGHFKIRHYFDLYLTQGPYFTKGFNTLKNRYKDFEVIETGWSKLDAYTENTTVIEATKKQLHAKHQAKYILLYAPTFSPKLTSATAFLPEIETLAKNSAYIIHIKFHDLMDVSHINAYKTLASQYENLYFKEERNIIEQLLLADVLISDTSSVIYEFLLLDKPVITLQSISKNIQWENIQEASLLPSKVTETLEKDPFASKRADVIAAYHPYSDGKSAQRMMNAIAQYIKTHGVPTRRKLPLLRKLKMNKMFDKNN